MTTQELIGWVESFTSDSEPYRSAIAAKLRAAEELAAAIEKHHLIFYDNAKPGYLFTELQNYRKAGETK